MTGWAYKTVTPEDLKFPVVYGEGKRSRVLATIGVTRGFGDRKYKFIHTYVYFNEALRSQNKLSFLLSGKIDDLRAPNSSILIKPFLSSQPEVYLLDYYFLKFFFRIIHKL